MRKTRIMLLQSMISLILCCSMLFGTTFAWFTDIVSTGINTIVAGNLDVELYHTNAAGAEEKVTAGTKLFPDLNGSPILWEPGVVAWENLRITNEGDLALAYQLELVTNKENYVLDPSGARYGLSQILKVGFVEGGITGTDRASILASVNDGNWTTLSSFMQSGSLMPEGTGPDEKTWGVVIYWEPGRNDDFWNLSNGKVLNEGEILSIDLGVRLVATQEVYESDSFGSDYDTDAKKFLFPDFVGGKASITVTPDGSNQTSAPVNLHAGQADAAVPAGVLLAAGTTELTLDTALMPNSGANITLGEDDVARSLNVHIAGVSEQNRVPITVTLKKAAPAGLNMGNYKLFHVESSGTNEMAYVDLDGAFTAHNQFKYDPATGDITLYMATFSEVAVVADTVNPWNGAIAAAFASGTGTEQDPYIIANADQLAWLGRHVSEGEAASKGKFYKLSSDINMGGDTTVDGNGKLLFYPIGYTAQGYQDAFQGTFDGAGHTIGNITQNTWLMTGTYDGTYYNDAMGLFGYVYGGTVKNLTVHNFRSQGEYAPTGCVAAYGANATFENIAVTGSHPQTYNTSVAAVVGRDGSNGCSLTFRNITVDSSNTVSALWGSWDVGAAGLLGYLGADSEVHFENCHAAATIDVYNDVCGNYQYYWYRYCGMLIGTVDKTRQDGSLDLSNITATNCTVNFGDRHEYYYCEFEKNSQASYTEDFQFSRVPHSELNLDDKPVTCTHDHTAAEDKQAVYLPFYQLFGGYGWGVDGVDLQEYNALQIDVDRIIQTGPEVSADKFVPTAGITTLESGRAYQLGDLFSAIEGAEINSASVTVSFTDTSPDNGKTVTVDYVLDAEDWTKSTITFTGEETIDITIQDYELCNVARLSGIRVVAPLISNEEFIYGSYFDHDRFEGNTGTRLTSAAYGLIRSADALLPAQDITIRVEDTDLTNYNVTLGYYTADGIYTGRNGIVPMVDGELTITAAQMAGAYFRVNVYIYNGSFTKVPADAYITVFGGESPLPELPEAPEQPTDPEEPTDPSEPTDPEEPTDPQKPWAGKKISIVGDSISTGSYPGMLANLTGANIQKLAVSGKRLAGGLTSMVADVDADADLVIIFGGTNDYWHKATRIGTADSTDPNTFNGALRYILNYLKTNHPNTKYLFVFPPDQTFGGNSCTTDFGYGTLADFRAAFLAFCQENEVPHVDLGETEFDSAKHSGDGVHPNSAGHQIIADAIYARIADGLTDTKIVNRQARLLPNVVTDLPEGALASAPGVQFSTAPYAYTNKNLFAGKHITRIGIPVKSVKALDENQTFTLSVVKTTTDAYTYVSQNVLKLPLEQLGSFTTVNKWIYVDVDITLAADETLAFGMPDDTVTWGYSKTNTSPYNFRSASGSWGSVIKESILFDVYATETLEFEKTEDGYAVLSEATIFPNVLTDFPESAIAGGNPVEFTNPPYSYVDQTLFAGKHITRIGIPVKSVLTTENVPFFTLSVIKQGSGNYQYVSQHKLELPLEQLNGSTTVNKWLYWDVDITLAADETLAFGGKEDTISWAWKSGFADTTYQFRDAKGGTTKGIFFDIQAETRLTYEEYLRWQQEEKEQLEAEQEQKRLDALLKEELAGKGISILGDSISTFTGWSNNTAYNSTIGSNAVWYSGSNGVTSVSETWWMQTITRAGLELVVNNSWSGDTVTNTGKNQGVSRSLQLHNNSGREPDIIAVYFGINDFRTKVTAESFAETYDAMVAGMREKYPNAKIFLFTLVYTTNVHSGVSPDDVVNFNAAIEAVAEKYNCPLVDLYNDSGISKTTMAANMHDGNLHPNYAGMDKITQCFMDALQDVYLQ